MVSKLEKDLFELKMSQNESERLIKSLSVDLELLSDESRLVDWAKQYILLLEKLSEAKSLVSQLQLEKTIYEKLLMEQFELKSGLDNDD